jgi:hypothetical protein
MTRPRREAVPAPSGPVEALRSARSAVDTARQHVSDWAWEVRQEAADRLGVTDESPADLDRIVRDPQYRDALDAWQAVHKLVDQLDRIAARQFAQSNQARPARGGEAR